MSEKTDAKAAGGGNCAKNIMSLDLYGRPFVFMLPNKQQRYKSVVGSLLTVINLFIVFVYAIYKVQLLSDKEDSRV